MYHLLMLFLPYKGVQINNWNSSVISTRGKGVEWVYRRLSRQPLPLVFLESVWRGVPVSGQKQHGNTNKKEKTDHMTETEPLNNEV